MAINKFTIEVPTSDDEVDVFTDSGFNCITLVNFSFVDEFTGSGQISIGGSLMNSPVELDEDNQTGSYDAIPCWSKSGSGGAKLTTINSTGAMRKVEFEVFGLIDDCPASSSSSSS